MTNPTASGPFDYYRIAVADMIPLEKCKDGFLYFLFARRSNCGIFNLARKSFTIRRTKLGHDYLFDEFHYETGEPFGTAVPLEELERAPILDDEARKLQWLELAAIRYTLKERSKELFKRIWPSITFHEGEELF